MKPPTRRVPKPAAAASSSSMSSDKASKLSALRSINTYLSSHNFPITFTPKPLPSANDITDTLKFVLSKLGFVVNLGPKRHDELLPVLKSLNYPHTIKKAAFRAPGAPCFIPLFLTLIHWLVQLAENVDNEKDLEADLDKSASS